MKWLQSFDKCYHKVANVSYSMPGNWMFRILDIQGIKEGILSRGEAFKEVNSSSTDGFGLREDCW